MKRKRVKLLYLVLTVAMLVTVLAGCSGKGENGGANSSSADDTLVLAVPSDVGPINGHTYASQMYAQNWLYDNLTLWEDNQVKPGLAESWDISEDGKEYTFHLRQGVTFTDGSKWNAEIAKKNIDAVLLHKEDHSWLEMLNQLKSAEVEDEYTLKLTLEHAYYPFLQELSLVRPLAFMAAACFPESGDTYKDGISEPIGTGKLELAEYKAGEYAVFARNDDYWGEKVNFKYVRVEVIPDANTQVAALKSGEIDMIFDIGGVLTADAFTELKNSGYTTDISGPTSTLALALNSARGVTADLNVRKAMEYAVNKDIILENVYYNLRAKADTVFDKSLPYCDIDLTTYEYDPDKATALLEESGWTLGSGSRFRTKDAQTLTAEYYYVGTDNVARTLGEVLQSMYEQVGIELKIIGEEDSSFGARQTDGAFNLIVSQTWGNQYDPHSMVSSYREPSHADFRAQEGMPNKGELDKWVTDLLVETDESVRQNYYTKILTELADQAIYLPICSTTVLVACDTDIAGITFNTDAFIPVQTLYRVK
ncbi:MAG: nickel ABC transporter substrate-binding protein [Peptococcaceae bacterium]